jgi:branched-chain amino acid transport system permease protein
VVFGLSFCTHKAGILSLGHSAFFGVGAYTAALFAIYVQPIFILAALAAGVMAVIGSLFIGFCAIRLKDDYLAISTLAFLELVRQLFYNWDSLTKGAYGLRGIPPANLFGFELRQPASYLLLSVVLSLLAAAVITRINKSPLGLSIQAAKDDTVAYELLGRRSRHLKVGALCLSAFFAGIAGAEYAFYVNYIHPSEFDLSQSVMFLATSIFATARSPILGCFLGLIVYFFLSEMLRLLDLSGVIKANVIQILTAVAILGVVVLRENRHKYSR